MIYCTPTACAQQGAVDANSQVTSFAGGNPTYSGSAYNSYALAGIATVTNNIGTVVDGHMARVKAAKGCPKCKTKLKGFIRLQKKIGSKPTRYLPVIG